MKVMVAGYYDPLHDGHLDHIQKAAKLGDYLVIVTHTDRCTEMVKGLRFTSADFRRFILRGILKEIGIKGEVIVSNDIDMGRTLKIVHPDIFAKGGDRNQGNTPKYEIDMCNEIGCKIIYGVGKLLNSSSNIKKKLRDIG
jgi:glycerol-3-phosphate cytidylyltransferase/D-beta-D-heptose 7-phosphate kinase/D-beta-D-heptose 1-phosphate adenosyltransferase